MTPYSIYIHVPFCTKKCGYCHFFVTPYRTASVSQYLEALKREIFAKRPLIKEEGLVSIYFGGGTPSLLQPEEIALILSWLPKAEEVTLEANPERRLPFEAFARAGINRLSIGVQSLDDALLATLTRTHGAQKAKEAITDAHAAGISNISIDLMYDVPHQTLDSWKRTLHEALTLPITHLSLYNLTIEPHTPFHKRKKSLDPHLPPEEESLKMLETAVTLLEEGGLKRYEISAFAKPGSESKHNLGYWTGRPFLGMGPSAYSYWDKKRFSNVASLSQYFRQEDPTHFVEELPKKAHEKELMAIGLRVLRGIPLPHLDLSLLKLIEEGFLAHRDERLFLTSKGLLFYDTVAEELIEVV